METGTVDREYPYRGRAPAVVLVLCWGGALAVLYWAATSSGPTRGRDGLATVGAGTASVCRWAAFGLCAAFAVLASRWAWIDRVQPCRIALTPRGIFVPRSKWAWFAAEEFVPFGDVTDCGVMVVSHLGAKGTATQLRFRGPRGRVWIARDNLPDGAFDEVCALVTAGVAAARNDRRP